MRVNDRLLVQLVEDEVVLRDESTGAEISVPVSDAWFTAAAVFIVASDHRGDTARPKTPAEEAAWWAVRGAKSTFAVLDEVDLSRIKTRSAVERAYPAPPTMAEIDAAVAAANLGCCSNCHGTGSSNDPETGGRCWDCKGTGHAHSPEAHCVR